MEIEERLRILKSLDTKSLVEKLHQYEDELEKALIEQADFKAQNHGYLGAGDCQEIKKILGEITAQAPEVNDTGKKMTIADREAWLQKQRMENKGLSDAIAKQQQVAFLLSDYEIKLEMTRRRLTSAIAVLALRTQQIAFLAGD